MTDSGLGSAPESPLSNRVEIIDELKSTKLMRYENIESFNLIKNEKNKVQSITTQPNRQFPVQDVTYTDLTIA